MRRLWLSLLLVPVMVAAVASAAWAAPAAPAASAARSAPAARTAPAAPARALQPGMKGSAVKALQRRLAALKYYPGAIDGKFGTSTLEAVWAFYEVQGLTPHNYVRLRDEVARWPTRGRRGSWSATAAPTGSRSACPARSSSCTATTRSS